ncbi:uncharacterized protein K02A2.6-like [Ostrea edulis]|uniref:uncharacterized protein K02A2.6-like n=1 Tax=Ostrea edulis TaxID=37623 RepID=UPI0024AF5143|nr:uncharacterized protein K02A2.6-like [Ostrea edulis]
MGKDIENLVSSCEICAKYQAMNPKEPMIPSELPTRPWSKIGMDLFELNGTHYLLTVDYLSKWPKVSKLESLTSKCVITHVKSMIAKYGIPDIVIKDNGPQFSSFEFREFVKGYQIRHKTTSPYHAQSNGQTERMAQTMKRLITKSHDPYVALLEYRNTKTDGIDLSPAHMFLGRRLKSIVPTTLPLLKSNINEDTMVKLKFLQEKQEENFNNHARKEPLKPLKPGYNVMMKNPSGQWTSGHIKDLHSAKRSYIVQSNGKHYRRNRKFLRPTRVRSKLEVRMHSYRGYSNIQCSVVQSSKLRSQWNRNFFVAFYSF